MKRLAALTLALSISGPAIAQPDPLCASIDLIMAAGREPQAFGSLAAASVPAGLDGHWNCGVKLGGASSRSNAASHEGRYNAFACEQLMPAGDATTAEDVFGAADAAYVAFSQRVHACLAPSGWSPLEEQEEDKGSDIFLRSSWLNPAVKGGVITELRIPRPGADAGVETLTTYLSLHYRVPLSS